MSSNHTVSHARVGLGTGAWARRSLLVALLGTATLSTSPSCTVEGTEVSATQTFRVRVLSVDGSELPLQSAPLPVNIGERDEEWQVSIEAVGPDGNPVPFDGYVRFSVKPGAVSAVESSTGERSGRNLRLVGGKADARVLVTAMHGPARLWVEDMGYVPAPEGQTPACSNGVNDDPDEDPFTDFPNDPGCAYADDDTETSGTFAAGVSQEIFYQYPSLRDLQGVGSKTPFSYEALQVLATDPNEVIVTRLARDGFYVTDIGDPTQEFNHLFVFSFSTPANMRVCDRVTFLSGTVVEFFGFTELTFPSFRVDPLFEGEEANCRVPPSIVLEPEIVSDALEMEKVESALVRLENYKIVDKFGPKPAVNNVFAADQSNCDFTGDGRIDFTNPAEASCSNVCSADPECTEWTGFVSRGNFKVNRDSGVIQINTNGSPTFDPVKNRGQVLPAVTGTLRNFSGGSLNWTVEVRCTDDLVCEAEGCVPELKAPNEACVSLRTIDDNDEASN
jgi:hypothetical protein